MSYDTDILIIGAGPAGLTAARYLAESDVDYVLLAQEDVPCKDKTCGGFVPTRTLQDFNVSGIQGAHEIHAIRMKFPGMKMVKVEFEESVGINTTRENLGQAMLNLVSNASDSVRMRSKVVSLTPAHDGIRVEYEREGERLSVLSGIVIDASGANSVSSRMKLVRPRISNEAMGYGLQFHLRRNANAPDFQGINDFYYGREYSPGGYAWVFPRTREVVIGTGGIVTNARAESRKLTSYLDNLIQNIEPTKSDVAGATIYKTDAALMPLAGIVTPSHADGMLLAGDAAGHCSPISGEGIHYAMVGGRYAAEVGAMAIRAKNATSQFLARYESMWKKEFGSDLKWGLWLQKRFTSGGSSSMGKNFLASEKSQRVIAEMLVGMRSVRGAILASAPGYLRSKIRI
ncbi:MAG: NAD(P)/FAD-dependent oxidoreductase [Candidatus Thorarchaeota archaeon]|nr:NAD(P)/FAD-dependent oxidoreductase [Candidatus Thorarchaeota archaeon]